jgi:hypothetical protein
MSPKNLNIKSFRIDTLNKSSKDNRETNGKKKSNIRENKILSDRKTVINGKR